MSDLLQKKSLLKNSKDYFENLNQQLKLNGFHHPLVIIDLDRLEFNIDLFKESFTGSKIEFRISTKSLPNKPLIEFIASRLKTQRLMVYHHRSLGSFLEDSTPWDILMGKPEPVSFFIETYRKFKKKFHQITWLVDAQSRLEAYIKAAYDLEVTLKLFLEIDIGMHRGGFGGVSEINQALQTIDNAESKTELRGIMAYEGHVPYAPSFFFKQIAQKKAFLKSQQRLALLIQKSNLNKLKLWVNGGGSLTSKHHTETSQVSEISIGSVFLNPAAYSCILEKWGHKAAFFIAAPILKKLNTTRIPFLPFLDKSKPSYFVYGGAWHAKITYPPFLQESSFLKSHGNENLIPNQNLLIENRASSEDSILSIGDFAFYHPHQGDAIFQFEDILPFREKSGFESQWPADSLKF
jgi:D-serine deaminase-like pyridoxal phosphate-dependent protein